MTDRWTKILFPQWQGAGNKRGTWEGAHLIHHAYLQNCGFIEVPVSTDGPVIQENGILGYQPLLAQLNHMTALLQQLQPAKLLMAGGDCCADIGPVSYLNSRYAGDLALIWLDAHGDINSPDTSPSHLFQGMPVRCLLGECDPDFLACCASFLSPEQVILAGVHDLDPPEAHYIKQNSITVLGVPELSACPERLSHAIRAKGLTNLHIHLDLDVLHMQCFKHVTYHTQTGISMDALLNLLQNLASQFNIVGFSLVEFTPVDDTGILELKPLIDFAQRLIGDNLGR